MSVVFAGLEKGAYGAVVADPPWHFRARTALQVGNWTSRRDAEKHYAVMGAEEIMALPVKDLAAKDCHLFIWTTGPNLPTTFEVIKAWGFRYSGVAFTWVKLKRSHNPLQLRVLPTAESDLHVGLGLTTRKNAEFCLLARRGNCKRMAKNVREIILAPVREHSRKPEEFRDRVEAYVGPDIRIAELFARSTRPGWDSWGNEVDKFSHSPATSSRQADTAGECPPASPATLSSAVSVGVANEVDGQNPHFFEGEEPEVASSPLSAVTGDEGGKQSVVEANERCQRPASCNFANHPHKITCSRCSSAWMARSKEAA